MTPPQIDIPAQGVQMAFWYVLAAISILLIIVFTSWRIAKLVKEEMLGTVTVSVNALASAIKDWVNTALEKHETHEREWRADDRREMRADMDKLSRRIDTLEQRIDVLLNRPHKGRSTDTE